MNIINSCTVNVHQNFLLYGMYTIHLSLSSPVIFGLIKQVGSHFYPNETFDVTYFHRPGSTGFVAVNSYIYV